MNSQHTWKLVGLLAACAALAACGTSNPRSAASNRTTTTPATPQAVPISDPIGAKPSDPSVAGLRGAASFYARSFLVGSTGGFIAQLDPRCIPAGQAMTRAQFDQGRAQLAKARDAAARRAGRSLLAVKILRVDVRNVRGTTGEAEAIYDLPLAVQGNDNWNSFAYSNGPWHLKGCEFRWPIGGHSVEGETIPSTVAP